MNDMLFNDDVFDALADVQRRLLLLGLLHHEPQHVSKLSSTSRKVADAHESLLSNYFSRSQEIPDVNEELLHTHRVHLPKLADYGFIEWCQDSHVVTKGPRFDELRPVLDLLDDTQDERYVTDPVGTILASRN